MKRHFSVFSLLIITQLTVQGCQNPVSSTNSNNQTGSRLSPSVSQTLAPQSTYNSTFTPQKPYSRQLLSRAAKPGEVMNNTGSTDRGYPAPTNSTTPGGYSYTNPNYSTVPVGQIGANPDSSSLSTFNGRVFDRNGNPIDGATVTATSIDPNVSWKGESQETIGGSYVFRNAPVGARLQITVSKDNWSATRTEVLKSNLTGDPNANAFDFNGVYALGTISFRGHIYDGASKKVTGAKVKAVSLDPNIPWQAEKQTDSNGYYAFLDAPQDTELKITVTKDNKEITRTVKITSLSDNTVNFGGTKEDDKKFAIASFEPDYGVNPFIETNRDELSTFAIDVDTASYTQMRRYLRDYNQLPPSSSVRIEEYLNYFDYNYPQPQKDIFSINLEMTPSILNRNDKHLLRVGIQGLEIKAENRKNAVLTFVIDVSGSMQTADRLEMVKNSLKILLDELNPNDKVAIITYSDTARVVMEHKSISARAEIIQAIESLYTMNSTNVEDGLRKGYETAEQAFQEGAINRIILCSDGVANTGSIRAEDILQLTKQKSERDITLTSIGFGMGNYNDELMEKLANNGNGYYAYVDNIRESSRIFKENLTDTLQIIAKDAKIQVEFNPQTVKRYRLLGYENRAVSDGDFRNDNVDAGEIGANHSVTALYEVELNNNQNPEKIAEVFLRFKEIGTDRVIEQSNSIFGSNIPSNFNSASSSFRLAAAVALYAEILRKSYWSETGSFQEVLNILRSAEIADSKGKVAEFIELVETANRLNRRNYPETSPSDIQPVATFNGKSRF